MPLITTRALILQTYRYSDTSKILRLMTREHGPVSAIARGALRPKSRFGGLLEPFAEGDVTYFFKEGRELHTLSGFDLVEARGSVGRDLAAFTAASVMSELVLRLAPEHPDPPLYSALDAGLRAVTTHQPPPSTGLVGLAHVWAIVAVLGFRPELRSCLSCGRPISTEPARFDYAAGGLRCGGCAGSGLASADEIAVLRALVSGGPLPGGAPGPQGRWLADFIRYHVSEGALLRSLPFLEQLP